MSNVALSSKFQIVIPKEVRKQFALTVGQDMEVRAEGGQIIVTPVLPMSAACGMFPGLDAELPLDAQEPVEDLTSLDYT